MTTRPTAMSTSAPFPQAALRVVHFQRKPTVGHFSVESHFADLRTLAQSRVDIDVCIMPHLSQGIIPRIRNMIAARKNQADVNHIVGDIHYAATLLDPSKTILTVLDCDMLHRTHGLRRALLKLFWFTLPSKCTAAITVISEATRSEVLRHIDYPAERVHVIPVFINAVFKYVPRPFNAEWPSLLLIGTRHNKNLERVILAVRDLPCHLVIVGILTDAQQQLLSESNISFQNHVNLSQPEILSLYENCDMLCFASTLEGFGMPILEAQAVGRPVVTSNCSSMPEVAGDGALLVNPFSVDEIRGGIQRVIGSPSLRDELVARGRLNAERFASARIVEQYCELYESL